jgi:hypothetical protein
MHPYETLFLKASWHVGEPFLEKYSAWMLKQVGRGRLPQRWWGAARRRSLGWGGAGQPARGVGWVGVSGVDLGTALVHRVRSLPPSFPSLPRQTLCSRPSTRTHTHHARAFAPPRPRRARPPPPPRRLRGGTPPAACLTNPCTATPSAQRRRRATTWGPATRCCRTRERVSRQAGRRRLRHLRAPLRLEHRAAAAATRGARAGAASHCRYPASAARRALCTSLDCSAFGQDAPLLPNAFRLPSARLDSACWPLP